MDAEQQIATSPSTVRTVFFNERGLRAGWRLLIFAFVFALLFGAVNLAFVVVRHGHPPQPRSNVLEPWPSVLIVILNFVLVLISTRVMSRLERRPMGVYGLPLSRSVFKHFAVGWFFWGFL